eukprot:jgi/Bigna1/147369/aug1.144_g22077
MAVNDEIVHSFRAAESSVERYTSGAERGEGAANGTVKCTIFRDGKEHDIEVKTADLSNSTMDDDIVLFGGASLQKPPFAACHQYGIPMEGVYVANFMKGSPAERYRLLPTSRIVEVDGKPTRDLDAFLSCVKDKADGTSIRMKIVTLQGHKRMITLKMDSYYWPTERIHDSERKGDWVRERI